MTKKVAWLRPSEFLDEWVNKHKTKVETEKADEEEEDEEHMHLFSKGIEPNDVVQGHLGNQQ